MPRATILMTSVILGCACFAVGCNRSGNADLSKVQADPEAAKAEAAKLAKLKEAQTKSAQVVVPAPVPDLAELLVKGSVWETSGFQFSNQQTYKYKTIVTERDGDSFKADMVGLAGQHVRSIEGTVKDGIIRWQGVPGKPNPGWYSIGTINGPRIEAKGYSAPDGDSKRNELGRTTMEFVPQDKK